MGPFDIDRFADHTNKKLHRFNSRYYCPGTELVNAFTADWSHDNNWLTPPVKLIGATLRHMRLCRASGCLLVPLWRTSYFWNLIFPDGVNYAEYVKGSLKVTKTIEYR